MTELTLDNVIARWVRAGVWFGAPPSPPSPDPERLLLDTARLAPRHTRLFTLAITWLSQYDCYVARHRLKRLVLDELELTARPVLGLLLDLAIKHGASRELNIAARQCGRADQPRPLFDVLASSAVRRRLAEETACPQARRRGLWAPDVQVKLDALRPASWIVKRNPLYRQRAARKGDLRTTIVETLRRDVRRHQLDSELALVKLCAANRPAVSSALDDLEHEGLRLRQSDPTDHRRTRIVLPAVA